MKPVGLDPSRVRDLAPAEAEAPESAAAIIARLRHERANIEAAIALGEVDEFALEDKRNSLAQARMALLGGGGGSNVQGRTAPEAGASMAAVTVPVPIKG